MLACPASNLRDKKKKNIIQVHDSDVMISAIILTAFVWAKLMVSNN